MPSSIEIASFVFGAILLAIALMGGALKFAGKVEIPKITPGIRIIAGILGAFFIAVSFLLAMPSLPVSSSSSTVVVTATQSIPSPVSVTNAPATALPLLETPVPAPTSTPTSTPLPPITSLTAWEALANYYSLLQQQQYQTTFQMLSDEFNSRKDMGFDGYRAGWEKSGPARITEFVEAIESGDTATVTATLFYYRADKQVYHTFRYSLIRYPGCGDLTFGCWKIMRTEEVP